MKNVIKILSVLGIYLRILRSLGNLSSKYSKLSGLMKLYNVKGKYGWSDQRFSALLEVLSDMFPDKNNVPKSMYEAKKTMRVLGLNYEKIHAYKNDCILF